MSYELESAVYEIDIRQNGTDKVNEAARAVEKEEAGIERLTAAMREHEQAAARVTVATTGMGTAMGQAGSKAGQTGQLLIQAGYAVDDLQYGFKGIANNIQPLLSTIPALAGLAGPLSIAAIAGYQLYTHWDQLQSSLGLGIPQPALDGPELLAENLKKAKKELEELAGKATLTWQELEKLGKTREEVRQLTRDLEAEKAVQAAVEAGSEAQKKAGAGFAKAIAESGGSRAYDQVRGGLGDQKDAKGLVLNPLTGKFTTVDAAARDITAAALKGDRFAISEARRLAGNSAFGRNIDRFAPDADEQGKKADAYYEKQDAEMASKKAEADEKARQADEADEKASEEYYRKQDEEHASKRAEADEKRRVEDREKAQKLDEQRATTGTGLDARAEQAMLRSMLAGGSRDAVTGRVTQGISRELQARGIEADRADRMASEKAEGLYGKLGDEIHDRAQQPEEMRPVDRIGVADFARSVESAGAKKMETLTEEIKSYMAQVVRNTQGLGRVGP